MSKNELSNLSDPSVGKALAKCYRILLGDEYMTMIYELAEVNLDKAIEIMQNDLEVAFGMRQKYSNKDAVTEINELF